MNDTLLNLEAHPELKAWGILLHDCDYRLEHPGDYHSTLMARADELRERGVVDALGWKRMKALGDAAYSRALAEEATAG